MKCKQKFHLSHARQTLNPITEQFCDMSLYGEAKHNSITRLCAGQDEWLELFSSFIKIRRFSFYIKIRQGYMTKRAE